MAAFASRLGQTRPTCRSLAIQLGEFCFYQEHEWSLGGSWTIGGKESVSSSDNAVLRIKASAREVYLVMSGPDDKPVTLKLNGQAITSLANGGSDVDSSGQVRLNSARLYKLVK